MALLQGWLVEWDAIGVFPNSGLKTKEYFDHQEALEQVANTGGTITPFTKEYHSEEDKLLMVFRINNKSSNDDFNLDYNVVAKHRELVKDPFYANNGEIISLGYYGKDDNGNTVPYVVENYRYERDAFGTYTKKYTDMEWYFKNNQVGYSLIDTIGKALSYFDGRKLLKEFRGRVLDNATQMLAYLLIAEYGDELGLAYAKQMLAYVSSYTFVYQGNTISGNALELFISGEGGMLEHAITNAPFSYMTEFYKNALLSIIIF